MIKSTLDTYRCPVTHEVLSVSNVKLDANGIVNTGILQSASGRAYKIHDGIPDFTWPEELRESDAHSKKVYDQTSDEIYDNFLNWLFAFYYEEEENVYANMVDLLNIKSDSKVLEIGCGTGRDTVHILKRLEKGSIYVQDLSDRMVKKCRDNLRGLSLSNESTIEYFVGNAAYLPFPDNYFDAVFHFGGINEFSEKNKAFAEMTRVVCKGGKVVVGDESMAPWLRKQEYGKMLINNNKILERELPLEYLPESTRQICVRWILGNSYYLIDYVVGEGPPVVNLDLPHKGKRGGTCRTRYYGQLEGVTLETKYLAQLATEKLGISMHEWLDTIVCQNAEKALKNRD